MYDILLKHLESTLSANGIAAYIWDISGDDMTWSGDVAHLFGDEAIDRNALNMRVSPQDLPQRLSSLRALADGYDADSNEHSVTIHYKVRGENGHFTDVVETASVKKNESGAVIICGFIRRADNGNNSAARPQAVAAPPTPVATLQAQAAPPAAAMDGGPVCALHQGRKAMGSKLDLWFSQKGRNQQSVSYLMAVGIDRTSMFNEVMGHRQVDEIIEQTGQRLKKIIGDAGVVCRIDGDVFGLFFEKAPHNEMAAVARHILTNFQYSPVKVGDRSVVLSLSIGGVLVRHIPGRDGAAFLTKAEAALRKAKEKGRNCFVAYHDASEDFNRHKTLLESGACVINALKEKRFRLAFQPVMGAQTHQVSFHEGLIRMQDEDGQILPAGSFMPAIESLGLSRIIDQQALLLAIEELEMFPDLNLSVNVSNLTLAGQDWLRSLVSALRDRPSLAQRLIIEITESAVIQNIKRTEKIVNTLRDLGARVALDDFGAGYTAFSQLKDLNVDIIKIDKSFIRNIDQDHNHLFVQTLQRLADGVNVETVGEGAETHSEAQILREDGITHIQGYVYGFPQVERVWLPKDHMNRRILFNESNGDREDIFVDKILHGINLVGH